MYKILVIDDDPKLLELVKYILQREGYMLFFALTGEQGIKVTKKEKPDLILMDIMLPKMDGLEAISKIKNDPSLKDIPIIILSALGQEMDIVEGLNRGAVSYIVKPFSYHVLLNEIKLRLK